jgi:phosphatidylserine/phosphatidylglycerophosphate/cardiolipin synthase-like enzyme
MRKKNFKSLIRWLTSFLILLIVFYFSEKQNLDQPQENQAAVLYSNTCHDDLEALFLNAIAQANESILLVIYSLSDKRVIEALNRQAKNGVSVKVIHDLTTPPHGFQALCKGIEKQGVKLSGLMHQKILIVDHKKVWLGSANFTTESLKLHANLVVGLIHPGLANQIEKQQCYYLTSCGNEKLEFWSLPERGKEGLKRLISLLDGAQKTVRVAMYTWTNRELTQATIRAHQRGVKVEVILDQGQALSVSRPSLEKLLGAGVDVRLSQGLGLLHHKFAWIDETYLINGSANWTSAAFKRNKDCFLIIYPLTEEHNQKMEELWKKTKILSQWQCPPLDLAA